MNVLKTTALAATLVLAAAGAPANERNPFETRVVSLAALDMTSAAGAEALYVRLAGAAREVCASVDGIMISAKNQYRTCVNSALSNAVAQVNQPLLTKVYDTHTRGGKIRVASR